MFSQETLRSLVKEAELYRNQGLLAESKARYRRVLELVQEAPPSPKHRKIIVAVNDRLRTVEEDLSEINQGTKVPKLSQDLNHLIKKLFSFSRTREAATLEGAIALAKFGQYDQAVAEFNKLLETGTLAVAAAKNILRCHMSLSSHEAAVSQFKQWVARGDLLSREELKFIRAFLEDALAKTGVKAQLPHVNEARIPGNGDESKEETLDITAISIQFKDGPLRSRSFELDVLFQLGNVISVIVQAHQEALLNALGPGTRLPDVHFYSPITVFKGSGMVSGRSPIIKGPNRGDMMLDISIEEE